jgi:hypothetical protein
MKRFWKRVDRMHRPVSHTAAVVAAVSLLLLIVIAWSAAGIPRAAHSPAWWGAVLLVAFVLASSMLTYFRPHAPLTPVPLVVAGTVLLTMCVWASAAIIQRRDMHRIYYPVIFAGVWVTWAVRKYAEWRAARAEAAQQQKGSAPTGRAATRR